MLAQDALRVRRRPSTTPKAPDLRGDYLLRIVSRGHLLGWHWEVSRSIAVLRRHEGMQIRFIEGPGSTHLVSHELPGIEQAVQCCPAYPEELGSLLKGEQNILLVETFSLDPDPLWAPVACIHFVLMCLNVSKYSLT